MFDGYRKISAGVFIVSEIQVSGPIIRTNGDGGAKVLGCLVGMPVGKQKISERVMRNVVVLVNRNFGALAC
jgi:hypothetical protein